MIQMSLPCWYNMYCIKCMSHLLTVNIQYFLDSALCHMACAVRRFRRIVLPSKVKNCLPNEAALNVNLQERTART
jgi:hypothetical protein